MRYKQLASICKERQPKVVLEIGTWNGERALEIMQACEAEYFGFDLFEEATEETDIQELNVKKHCRMEDVKKKLNGRSQLIKGNTRDTLPEFAENCEKTVDLAYIDGGHSIETIQSDWNNIRPLMAPDGVVIFDDYYVPEKKGFGCNQVVKSLKHAVLPVGDRILSGESVYFVKVEIAENADV
jgi:predicted O-methyltransferase YrrM